jgi:hypothetical protein
MTITTVTDFEMLVEMAEKLSTLERVKLIERLTQGVFQDMLQEKRQPLNSFYGIGAHLGPGASEEDLAEVRREMLANFPRENVG